MLHRKLSHALAFFSLPQEREYGHECDPSMLSTNAYPTFTFRLCVLCSNSDRSVSSYSVHWACICCWGDGTGQSVVPPRWHPTGSWLLPLSCSSRRLLFLYCISGRVSRGVLVPGEQLAFCPPNLPTFFLQLCFPPFLFSAAGFPAQNVNKNFTQVIAQQPALTVVWLVGRGVGRPAWEVSLWLWCVVAGSPFSPSQGNKGESGNLHEFFSEAKFKIFKFSTLP